MELNINYSLISNLMFFSETIVILIIIVVTIRIEISFLGDTEL